MIGILAYSVFSEAAVISSVTNFLILMLNKDINSRTHQHMILLMMDGWDGMGWVDYWMW